MMPLTSRAPQDSLELELIRSLSATLQPSTIMSVGFGVTGGLIYWSQPDGLLLALLVLGLASCAVRLAIALRLAAASRRFDFAIERARRLEASFQVSHSAFAILLGLFGLRTFAIHDPTVHMLTVCLLMGYAAGVAATVALRPRIAIPSMLLAVAPTIIAAVLTLEPIYVAMGLMSAAFLYGGVQNVRVRAARASGEIALRITFGNVARKDALTALPNRIALAEWFQERQARTSPEGLIAVHYLDLDGFKPINDRHGHPFGDALLTAVGKRIVGTTRDNDIAARLGGDEFAVVQFGIGNSEDANHLAWRLFAALARPFEIDGRTVEISASVGYVVKARHAGDLEHLLALADRALYQSKNKGGGVTRHQPEANSDNGTAARNAA